MPTPIPNLPRLRLRRTRKLRGTQINPFPMPGDGRRMVAVGKRTVQRQVRVIQPAR